MCTLCACFYILIQLLRIDLNIDLNVREIENREKIFLFYVYVNHIISCSIDNFLCE